VLIAKKNAPIVDMSVLAGHFL